MSALSLLTIGWCLCSPTLAPVPADPPPDPLGRGYLGAYFATSAPSGQLTIDRVEPGTPAANAGITSGDVIVRVGHAEPKTFEELVAHITAFRPGAVVDVVATRDGERKKFKVKLMVRDVPADRNESPVPIPIEIPDR